MTIFAPAGNHVIAREAHHLGIGRDQQSPAAAQSGSEAVECMKGDELFLLGERIADLAASINAAEGRMMTLLADFDRRGGWQDGFSSCAEWLAWRTGIKIGPARERVRAARALENLPETADALRTSMALLATPWCGNLSWSLGTEVVSVSGALRARRGT